jgi:hypothetical protein
MRCNRKHNYYTAKTMPTRCPFPWFNVINSCAIRVEPGRSLSYTCGSILHDVRRAAIRRVLGRCRLRVIFQTSGFLQARSVRPSTTDMSQLHRHVGFVPLTEVSGRNYRETRVVFMSSRRRSVGRLRPCCPLKVDHKIAPDRHRITSGRQQHLKHHMGAMQEFELDGGEIELPHPAEPFVVDRNSSGSILREALAPMLPRIAIMQP